MKRLMTLLMVMTMMLVLAAPAWADTVTAGGLISGTAGNGVVVAGNPNLLDDPAASADLPVGTDIAAAGDLVPPGVFAAGVNIPFEVDFGVAGMGALEDDTFIQSDFLGTDLVETGFGNLSADTENGFME